MKKLAEYQDDLPTWALSAIYNGDDSGLEPDEIAMVNHWCKQWEDKAAELGGHVVYSAEKDEDGEDITDEFNRSPAFGLACGTESTVILILGEGEDEPDTETAFNVIMQSEIFRLNGPKIDLCEALQTLCAAIKDEDETNWSLGEFGECALDSLLVGAYWALSEWHAGQPSPEYAALCAIGGIFSPGCTSAPTSDEESEYWPYVAVNNYFARTSPAPQNSESRAKGLKVETPKGVWRLVRY